MPQFKYTARNIAGKTNEGLIEARSEEHTSELQSQSNLVCRLLLEKKKNHVCNSLSKIQRTAYNRGTCLPSLHARTPWHTTAREITLAVTSTDTTRLLSLLVMCCHS